MKQGYILYFCCGGKDRGQLNDHTADQERREQQIFTSSKTTKGLSSYRVSVHFSARPAGVAAETASLLFLCLWSLTVNFFTERA